MKKHMKALSILMVLGMILSFAGCGSSKTATTSTSTANTSAVQSSASDDSAEANRTKLVVGFDAEYPPYGYKDEKTGEYTGFDLELAQEVCDRRGWELVKQPIDWDAKDMELNSGSVDCLWNGVTITGRENDYTWSDPYVDNSIVIVVRNDSDIQKLSDLAGKVVTTQADSSALSALTVDPGDGSNDTNLKLAATFASLEQVADYNTAFMNLKSGVVDAIAVDIGVAQYQLSSNEGQYRQLDDPISTEQYAIAFKKGNTSLRDAVQKTLYEMLDDGTFTKIVDKYADFNLPEMVCLGKDK